MTLKVRIRRLYETMQEEEQRKNASAGVLEFYRDIT